MRVLTAANQLTVLRLLPDTEQGKRFLRRGEVLSEDQVLGLVLLDRRLVHNSTSSLRRFYPSRAPAQGAVELAVVW